MPPPRGVARSATTRNPGTPDRYHVHHLDRYHVHHFVHFIGTLFPRVPCSC